MGRGAGSIHSDHKGTSYPVGLWFTSYRTLSSWEAGPHHVISIAPLPEGGRCLEKGVNKWMDGSVGMRPRLGLWGTGTEWGLWKNRRRQWQEQGGARLLHVACPLRYPCPLPGDLPPSPRLVSVAIAPYLATAAMESHSPKLQQ